MGFTPHWSEALTAGSQGPHLVALEDPSPPPICFEDSGPSRRRPPPPPPHSPVFRSPHTPSHPEAESMALFLAQGTHLTPTPTPSLVLMRCPPAFAEKETRLGGRLPPPCAYR